MNKEICNKIQELIMETSPDCIQINRIVDAEIAKVLETYSGTLEENEFEELSDQLIDVLSAGLNEAYRTGAKHCLQLIIETLADWYITTMDGV